MLTRSQSSWKATLLATQSRRKSTTGLVAQIGNHTVKSGSMLQSFTAFGVGEAEVYAAVKGSQVDSERDSVDCWKKRIIRWINWKQYIKENTKMHGTFGYKNKIKTKTSVPRKKRIAQILERDLSSLQYCNDIQTTRLVFCKAMDPTLHYHMKVTSR